MPLDEDVLVRTKDDIVAAMLAEFAAAIPDVWTGEDGILRLITETMAGPMEGLYIANQILREDSFIQTANVQSLEMYGEMYGLPRKAGERATGQLVLSGAAGTYIPIETQVAYDPGLGEEEVLVFLTDVDGTIPNPGIPTVPIVVDSGVAGTPNGTYEYAITFVTATGETVPGAITAPLAVVSRRIDVSSIPLGGAGTTGRRIYRRPVGGIFKRVATIADNTTTTYQDNIADASLGAEPLAVSTALSISVNGIAEDMGVDYNVVSNAIGVLVDVPEGISSVTNPAPFAGGTDEEDAEAYRERLLQFFQAPGTGSPTDVKSWCEEIEGVESATVFSNDNLGTPTNGHVTVRISGPNGTVPPAEVITEVQTMLDEKGLANITYHVTTFTPVATNVTVDVALLTGYALGDVTPSVQQAVTDYINDLDAGGTAYIAGIYDAVFGLPGIATLVVTTPASDQTTTATQKRVAGTITVV